MFLRAHQLQEFEYSFYYCPVINIRLFRFIKATINLQLHSPGCHGRTVTFYLLSPHSIIPSK